MVRFRTALCAAALIASATLSAQSPVFERGQQVVIKPPTKASDPKQSDMTLTVVAVPDDRLSVRDNALYVNDNAVTRFSQEFVQRVLDQSDRIPSQVPAGHYFVMGELRNGTDISEYFGQHSAQSLQAFR
jgi:signal peptidase I